MDLSAGIHQVSKHLDVLCINLPLKLAEVNEVLFHGYLKSV